MQTIFRQVFARNLDKLEAVVTLGKQEFDFDPDQSERSGRATGRAFACSNPARAPKIAAIDVERRCGYAGGQNERSGNFQKSASCTASLRGAATSLTRSARVEAIVRDAGGELTPIDIALGRQTIYGAIAEANFWSARRHGTGGREETAAPAPKASSESGSRSIDLGAERPKVVNRRAADSPCMPRRFRRQLPARLPPCVRRQTEERIPRIARAPSP